MTFISSHKAVRAVVCIMLTYGFALTAGSPFSMPEVPSLQKAWREAEEKEAARRAEQTPSEFEETLEQLSKDVKKGRVKLQELLQEIKEGRKQGQSGD